MEQDIKKEERNLRTWTKKLDQLRIEADAAKKRQEVSGARRANASVGPP